MTCPGPSVSWTPYSLSPSGGDLSAANGDIPGQSGLCSPAPPRPKSAFGGDRQRLERPSQMGPRDTQQLLIIGALAVVRGARALRRARALLARPHAGGDRAGHQKGAQSIGHDDEA